MSPMDPVDDVDAIEVDARGLRCPLPVIQLAKAARDASVGTRIIVLADDPAARHDIPAWCRMRDHELREVTELTDPPAGDPAPAEGAKPAYLRFVVVVRPQPSKAAGTGSGRARSSRAR